MGTEIAKRLVEARGDIPRTVVANAVGVSISAITMYETGKRVPRDEIKVRLASYYKTTVQNLFFGENATISGLKSNEMTSSATDNRTPPGELGG